MIVNSSTILLIVCTVLVISFGAIVAFRFGRRTKTSGDWIVAGRSLPLYVVVFTQFATAVGGGVLVAHVGIAYAWGFSVFWYELFSSLGLIVIALIARWLREQKFSTVPEILRRLYVEHPLVTVLAAVASIVVPFGWLATQFVAFAKLFSEITGIPLTVLIIVMSLVSLIFVLPGGLLSVAWTDFFFGVFMVVVSVAVGAYAIHLAGGWSTITTTVPEQVWGFPDSLGAAGIGTIALWFFAVLPGSLTNQLYYQRVFATQNIGQVRRGLVIAAGLSMIAGVYASLVGISVRSMNPSYSVDERESAAGWFLTQLPPWLLAIFGAFVVATIVSTTGSALQSVVTNVVRDLYSGLRGDRSGDTRLVAMSKAITVVVTIVAAALAISYPAALDLLVSTYAYSAAMLAAPIFGGYVLHRRGRLRTATALAGMIGGLAGCGVAQLVGTAVPFAVFGIAASTVCLFVTHAVVGRAGEPITKPGDGATAERIDEDPEPETRIERGEREA